MRTIQDSLIWLDKNLYHNKDSERKEVMFNFIKHLSIKNYDKVREILHNTINLAETPDNLLVPRSLYNILIKEFMEETADYVRTEKARRFLEDG